MGAEIFRLDSNRDGASLSLATTARAEYFDATVSSVGVTAVGQFHEPALPLLAGFFAELAEAWRGWEGDRSWSSHDGELQLTASHDQLGIVAIGVSLRSGVYLERDWLWQCSAVLCVDPGALARLARTAETRLR